VETLMLLWRHTVLSLGSPSLRMQTQVRRELTARHPAGRVEITSGPAQPHPTVFWETVFEVTA
jgi:hypothetical protein